MSAPTPVVYEDRNHVHHAVCCGSFAKASDSPYVAAAALIAHLDAEHGVTLRPERLPEGFETACELCGGVSGGSCDECDGAGWVIEVMVPR